MNKKAFFIIIVLWFLLTQMFPPFNILFSMGGAINLIVFAGFSLVLFPDLFLKRSVLALVAYSVLSLVYYIFGSAFFKSINYVIVPFLCMLPGLIISEYAFTYDKDYKFTRLVVIFSIALNAVMAIITIPQLLVNPLIIRSAEDVMLENDISGGSTHVFVITYQTLHGLPCLFAPMLFLCKKSFRFNKKVFAFWFVIVVLFFVLQNLGNAVTAFLLSIIMIIIGLAFSFERFNVNNVIKVFFVGLLAMLFLSPKFLVPIIETVQNMVNPTANTYYRLEEIKDAVIYGESEGDLAARQDLYDNSKALFWESPLTGTANPEKISRHTWIWDRLALFGIIFIMPLIWLFVSHIKRVYSCLNRTKVIYVFGVFSYIIMLYLKNDFGTGTWLYAFGVLPLLCRYTDYVMDNKLKN